MASYFLDTGFFLGLLLPLDEHHNEAVQLLDILQKEHSRLFTSNDVYDETVTRLVYLGDKRLLEQFIELWNEARSKGLLEQLWVDEVIQQETFAVLERYFEHSLSATDASSYVLIQRFKIDGIVTFDSDFKKVGLVVLSV